MEYKSTLNLPNTNFPMKANLNQNEPRILDFWTNEDVYNKIRNNRNGKEKYVLHDGPPYANGNIHIGHALNKILKDIIVRFKTMQGFDSPYVPGWDCHGLPVEHQLFKELRITKEQISQVDFRKKAYDYALNFVTIQKEEFKRLGVFGDWQHPYLTLDKKYEYEIVKALGSLVKGGFIYRGLKPVNWCLTCETALAEAEVEYEDKSSPSIYVKFKIADKEVFPTDTYLAIWTTTPWTLYGNVAVAVHPDVQYVIVKTNKGNLVIAKKLVKGVFKDMSLDLNSFEVIRETTGKDLEGISYIHPFLKDGLTRKVVLADYVSQEEGTGLVHTAPGHGQEDYFTGLKYGLPILMPVDSKGRFDKTSGELSGKNVLDANKLIVEKLRDLDCLLFFGQKQHSYPHCWRCKNPIIFRATKQWFLSMNHNDLRKKVLLAIEEDIRFIPEAGKERIKAMVEFRPDWCLSRQRYWGVPIPAVRCVSCCEEILDCRIIENFANEVKDQGSDAWFKEDVNKFLVEDFSCPNCKGNKFSRGEDILDVWFDSGVSHRAVLIPDKALEFPASLYLEGSDQHRGWFQASLIPSVSLEKIPPFKRVLTHGFVVDGEGRKMSKSMGNVIKPQDIIKDHGADILRLWVASSDYNEDVRISPVILNRLAEAYRKIRNTARFILSNLYDFNPDTDKISYDKLNKIDKWILCVLEDKLLNSAKKAYENFAFYKAYREIYDFCNVDLSMFYLDMVKGRLYTFARTCEGRRAAQTTIYEVLSVLVRVIAPILTFTAEEIWQHMPKENKDNSFVSVHLLSWPQKRLGSFGGDLTASGASTDIRLELQPIMELIPDIAKVLEDKRSEGLIGSSFDAKIKLLTNNEIRYNYLTSLKEDLAEIFKVSQVEILNEGNSDLSIEAAKASGQKCQRCWNYSVEVGKDKCHPDICARCISAVEGR